MANTFNFYKNQKKAFCEIKIGDCFIYNNTQIKEKMLCIKINDTQAFVLYNLTNNKTEYWTRDFYQADMIIPCDGNFTF